MFFAAALQTLFRYLAHQLISGFGLKACGFVQVFREYHFS